MIRCKPLSFVVLIVIFAPASVLQADERPNIFIAISDDVSWPHKSAYGSKMVTSPAFDRVANDGVLFHNAFAPAPGCSPSRAAFLTGRHIWMIEHAGTHASYFATKYRTFPEVLQDAGYFVGSTGKAWGPGNYKHAVEPGGGREHNPAGKSYGGKGGYVGGFQAFMDARPQGQPFCFWFGSTDAHRSYEQGSGLKKGKTLDQAEVPGFLPDHEEIRSDLLDYAFEIERFDNDLDLMLELLDEAGELDNTLVIVTSDNGMPFPRAKANCYEFGIHMPLAVCWKDQIPGDRELNDLVGFVDLTATIYDAAGVEPPGENPLVGTSLLADLKSGKAGLADESRTAVYSGRERHSSSRFNTLSYPQRAIRTPDFLYILNLKPERWPAGAPRKYSDITFNDDNSIASSKLGPMHGGYHDIDGCPTLDFLIAHRDDSEFGRFLGLSVDKRPAEELFDIQIDPDCLRNLADDPGHATVKRELHDRLMNHLKQTGDARVQGNGDVWETYPRVSSLRWFEAPDWATQNPGTVPNQEWLDDRRPR